MLVKNGNKERLICTKHAQSHSRPKTTKTTPPLRVAREVTQRKEFQGEKFKFSNLPS
jgi:hypothetical protein